MNLELSKAIRCQQGDELPGGAAADVAEHFGVTYYMYQMYIEVLKDTRIKLS